MTYELVTTTPNFSISKCSDCGDKSRIRLNEDRRSRYNRLEKARRRKHIRSRCGTKNQLKESKHPVPGFYNVGSAE